jgi:hypothetical protein
LTLTKNDDKSWAPPGVQPAGLRPVHKPGKRDELLLLINSRNPILTIETPEEERVEQMLFEVAAQLNVPLFSWSVTTGLARFHGAPIYNAPCNKKGL